MNKRVLFICLFSVIQTTHAAFFKIARTITSRQARTLVTAPDTHTKTDDLVRKLHNLPPLRDGLNPHLISILGEKTIGAEDFYKERTLDETHAYLQTIVTEILTGKLGKSGVKAVQAAIPTKVLTDEMKVRMAHYAVHDCLSPRHFALSTSHLEAISKEIPPQILIDTLIHKIELSYGLGASTKPIDPDALKALRKALFKYRLDRLDDGGTFFWIAVIAIFLYEFSVLDAVWTTEKESRLIE